MRLTQIVIVYFVIGAVMWGGGVIAWEDSGVGGLFVQTPSTDTQVNQETTEDLSQLGGPIQIAASTVQSAGIVAIWNVLVKLVGLLMWPIVTLLSVDAPPRVVVLLGGTPTVAFFGAFIKLVRSSA